VLVFICIGSRYPCRVVFDSQSSRNRIGRCVDESEEPGFTGNTRGGASFHDRRLEVSYDRVSWAEVTGPVTASALPCGRAKSATSDAVNETAAATRKAN
jgi:hypothetical protein